MCTSPIYIAGHVIRALSLPRPSLPPTHTHSAHTTHTRPTHTQEQEEASMSLVWIVTGVPNLTKVADLQWAMLHTFTASVSTV